MIKVKTTKIPGIIFINEVINELKKTEWLSPKEVVKLSITVLISTTLLGFFLHFLDILFRYLLSLIA